MDVLKNKQYETYDYPCRYRTVPFYYHTVDQRYVYGIGSNMQKDLPYVLCKVTSTDTLDSLALKYYGNPTYFWVIAYFNDIQDCFEDLLPKHATLRIPNLTSVVFGAGR